MTQLYIAYNFHTLKYFQNRSVKLQNCQKNGVFNSIFV